MNSQSEHTNLTFSIVSSVDLQFHMSLVEFTVMLLELFTLYCWKFLSYTQTWYVQLRLQVNSNL